MTAFIIVVKSPAHFFPLRRFRLTSGMSRCGSNHAGMKKKRKKEGLQIFSWCTKRRMKTQDWHPTTSRATNHLRQNMCAASTGYTWTQWTMQGRLHWKPPSSPSPRLGVAAVEVEQCSLRYFTTGLSLRSFTTSEPTLGVVTTRETNGPTTLQEQCKNNLYTINSGGRSPGQWTGPASRKVFPTSFRFISHIHLVQSLRNVFGKLGAKFWTVTVHHPSNWRSYCFCCQVAWAQGFLLVTDAAKPFSVVSSLLFLNTLCKAVV